MARKTEKLNVIIKAKDMYSSELKRMQDKFSVAGIAITGVMAALGGSMIKVAKDTVALGDQFQKMSIRTGVSTQALSEMAHVAEISGTNIETVEAAIRKMSKTALDADTGMKTASDTFVRLGINVHDVNGNLKDSETLFFEVLQGLRDIQNETARAATAQEVFGKSGTQLLTIVNESAGSVERLREEARQLGITFSQQAADDAARMNDEFNRLAKGAKGLTNELGKSLVPVLAYLADRYVKFFKWVNIVTKGNEDQSTSMSDLNAQLDVHLKLRDEIANQEGINLYTQKRRLDDIDAEISKINTRRSALLQEQKEKEVIAQQEEAKKQAEQTGGLSIEFLQLAEEETARQELADRELAYQRAIDQMILDDVNRKNKMLKAGVYRTTTEVAKALDAMSEYYQGRHRTMFEALKVAKIAESIVNTYAAANQVLADPALPTWAKWTSAAAIIAGGLANVAIIKNTSFGGGATSGGGVSGAAAYDTSALSTPVPTTTTAEQQQQNVTIQIYGSLATAEEIDKIIETHLGPGIKRAQERNVL